MLISSTAPFQMTIAVLVVIAMSAGKGLRYIMSSFRMGSVGKILGRGTRKGTLFIFLTI